MLKDLDLSQQSLYLSAASICFNPLFWNIVARNEYRQKTIQNIVGSPKVGCYLLGATIFSLGLIRDYLYKLALEAQPASEALNLPFIAPLSAGLVLVGNVLVLSSYFRLGFVGTFLGDYFGILMDEPVTGFPFNVSDNPMYHGSTLIFLGTALWYQKLSGVYLTVLVSVVYYLAIQFENPFTTMIYANRDKVEKKKSKKLN
ncbi:phospholipid methyltransferase [Conidiobolus coronatus NRRL 28638]|uniref:Phosphatidyl-N-methylethanolamine N-methyltransferase n=1 Tax=Conidiobolus coronatus (strain ATCC 28846 / CBS 209.66 / NRRL 28638) TaxID=796925 RepID=A0A137NWG6_CONC2|nr:phospholipid methyltransferase [Conidiobolus coronatus NRRL 28638]|eukprot:KXN67170.1 phospholipid methyltransferase [Conidiobolus coronatus NRRL 28638]